MPKAPWWEERSLRSDGGRCSQPKLINYLIIFVDIDLGIDYCIFVDIDLGIDYCFY